jgi:hypothetical protein
VRREGKDVAREPLYPAIWKLENDEQSRPTSFEVDVRIRIGDLL